MNIYNWYTNTENCVAPVVYVHNIHDSKSVYVRYQQREPISLELVGGGDEDNKRSYQDDCCSVFIRGVLVYFF